jgi:Protein of unknown function (DUF2939)
MIRKPMIGKLIAGVVALALLFLAWPLWSAWQLHRAMKTRDIASLEARVDWATLRANMKPRITQAIEDNAANSGSITGALKRAISGVVADKGVDLLVTPQTLGRLLAGREFVASKLKRDPKDETSPAPKQTPPAAPDDEEIEGEDPEDPMPPRRLRWAFFESFGRFRIEAIHPRLKNGRMVAILGQQGFGWKLIDVSFTVKGTTDPVTTSEYKR